MSRKSLIICLAVLAAMILGVGIAVAFLYSGTGGGRDRRENVVPDQERYLLLPAVPADAVFVACLSDAGDAVPALLSGFSFMSELADSIRSDSFDALSSRRMSVSLHYTGSLQALYVFDMGKASAEPSEDASALMAFAGARGMYCDYVDCSSVTDGNRDISRRSLVLLSESETLVKSSERHLEKSISIMDATGFAEASAAVNGPDVMFFSNSHAKTLMAGMFSGKYASYSPFVSTMSQWTVAGIGKADASGTYMTVRPVFGGDPAEYMTVLSKSEPGTSKVSQVLPSFTISALSLPVGDVQSYMAAYQGYMDSRQSLQSYRRRQRDLETRTGISPEEFFTRLEVKEIAKASFLTGGAVETVNLMRIGREDDMVFLGAEGESFRDYKPAIHSWPFYNYASSVFGGYFDLGTDKNTGQSEENCFTYIDGWIVTGTLKAVEEYSSGRALGYSLVEYIADAGQKDMLASQSASMVVYHSFTEYPEGDRSLFTKAFAAGLGPFREGGDFCPVVITMTKGKDGLETDVRMPKLTMMRTKAPEFVRDTTVVIPQGPFEVMNSGTGQKNRFYQNSYGSLCLRDENGKDLWGVPFKGKLCGTAYNVDYYANGKQQIIFGSGKKIYIIDRLGRLVNGFPIELEKEILLGPDVYDFNNSKAYNIMVLHKGNTIEMYNLKGRKPASWKSITAPETIKGLPERLIVGGKTFWVVRTAIQTLIYPFNGGAALTTFKGDEMIRPDSGIEIVDGSSVKVDCYDGKTRKCTLT